MANRVQVFFNQFPQFDYPDPDPDPPFDLLSIHDEEEYGTSDEDNYDAIYILSLPRTITTNPSSYNQQELIVIPDDDESQNCFREDGSNKRCRTELESEASRSKDIDHLLCPICMDVWTSSGDHHICCLPCGHMYGLSCIKKWLQQHRNSNKCPQCNRNCSIKDVRKLYASPGVAVDEESLKRIRSLEAKCTALESKDNDWRKKEAEWQKREAALHLQVEKLTKVRIPRMHYGLFKFCCIEAFNETLGRAEHMSFDQRIAIRWPSVVYG
uniref:RING-type domain-containing protein n=1 Tax=Glycine max TaxID=3847 RepID=A0A0R0KRF6_SOYBN